MIAGGCRTRGSWVGGSSLKMAHCVISAIVCCIHSISKGIFEVTVVGYWVVWSQRDHSNFRKMMQWRLILGLHPMHICVLVLASIQDSGHEVNFICSSIYKCIYLSC